jgi:Trk-type K+ transport system membrane component
MAKSKRENKVGAWWFAIFLSVSAFNNAGLGLFADNMVPFAKDVYVST